MASGSNGGDREDTGIVCGGTWGTCAWEVGEDGTLLVHGGRGANAEDTFPGWQFIDERHVKRIVVGNGKEAPVVLPEDCTELFAGFADCEHIRFANADGTETFSVRDLFCDCGSVERIDLRGLILPAAEDMCGMFYGCGNLKKIDFGKNIDTSNVLDMSYMFSSCSSLETVDLIFFEVSQVLYLNNMFEFCCNLRDARLEGWNSVSAENTKDMFYGCRGLRGAPLGSYDLSHAGSCKHMLALVGYDPECIDITGLPAFPHPDEFFLAPDMPTGRTVLKAYVPTGEVILAPSAACGDRWSLEGQFGLDGGWEVRTEKNLRDAYLHAYDLGVLYGGYSGIADPGDPDRRIEPDDLLRTDAFDLLEAGRRAVAKTQPTPAAQQTKSR